MTYMPTFLGSTSTRDKIISLFARRQSLSTKEVLSELKKSFAVNVTYQAVHKALKQLVDQEIISFDGKVYVLNPRWLTDMGQFLKDVRDINKETQASSSIDFLFCIVDIETRPV
jgi:predicted transcriptional regulator